MEGNASGFTKEPAVELEVKEFVVDSSKDVEVVAKESKEGKAA